MKTRQEIFNTVATHLLTQNAKSFSHFVDSFGDWREDCFYRGCDGLKCAIGALIPDDCYMPEFERHSILYLFKEFSKDFHMMGLDSVDGDFLFDLQLIHDGEPAASWKEFLRNFARKNKLSYAVLRKL